MREKGFVSLLTCILISLLLLVVTLSMVSLEALQLRKAEDAEQTLRAYYAAEAGVEDAVSKVLSKVVTAGSDQLCPAVGSSNTTFDIPGAAGWTCQQITFSGKPFGKLDAPDVAQTVDPSDRNYDSVLVEWDQSSDPVAAHYNVNLGSGFPTQPAYTAAYAAAPLELGIVQYPRTGFRASDVGATVKLQNAVIVPGGAGASGAINYAAPSFKTNGPWRGNCVPGRSTGYSGRPTRYNCYAIITGLDASGNTNYLFRLRSRYAASAYQMTFFAGGAEVQVPDGTATIDVTARAGQTYRRVISKLPLSPGAAGGLNYVIYSDTNVCKDLQVLSGVVTDNCP